MKKAILLFLVMISQVALAQRAPVREVKGKEINQYRAKVEKLDIYKEVERVKATGKDVMTDVVLKDRIMKAVDASLKDVVVLSPTQKSNIAKLLNIDSLEVMSQLARLTSIAKHPGSTPAEKNAAAKTIELIAQASHTVDTFVLNEAAAKKEQAKIKEIVTVSEKIANLSLGEQSQKFTTKYEAALKNGKTVKQAIELASEGKFKIKELLDCV
jgi:hypothetical protein